MFSDRSPDPKHQKQGTQLVLVHVPLHMYVKHERVVHTVVI